MCHGNCVLQGTVIDLQFMQPYQSCMSCKYELLRAESINQLHIEFAFVCTKTMKADQELEQLSQVSDQATGWVREDYLADISDFSPCTSVQIGSEGLPASYSLTTGDPFFRTNVAGS